MPQSSKAKTRFGGICISCGEPMIVPENQMAGIVHDKCKNMPSPTSNTKTEKKYKVVVWCNDCCGIDFQGCFEGGRQELDKVFNSEKEADEYGDDYTDASPWDYEVIEA